MRQWITELEAANVGIVKYNEPLADYTTWKIGGPADVFVVPSNKDNLLATVRLLHRHGIPWMSIGKGSNMLVSDKGFRGVVIKLGEGLNHCRIEGNVITAGGSYSLTKLTVMAGKAGLSGLEFAGGIPGTVGGAVYMNAGAHGSDVSRILVSAEVVLENGELAVLSNEELQFGYRHSVLQESKGIVTEAVFQLEYGDSKKINETMAALKSHRLMTQPLQLKCAGSVFRNPPGHYAARLIEEAGLKGLTIGGAVVSPLHANFIVNTGNATASDVLTLIEIVRRTVKDRFGVELITEVLVVGER